jgi:hypothetical protein
LGFGAKLGKRRISIIPHVQTSPDYSLRVDATAAAMARTLGAGLSLIVVLCMGLSLLIHRGIWPIERMALMIVCLELRWRSHPIRPPWSHGWRSG